MIAMGGAWPYEMSWQLMLLGMQLLPENKN